MNRIKELRISNGLTQDELGKKLKVQKSAVSKYETERVPLTAETITQLTEIFDVSADYLLGNSDIKKFDAEQEQQPLTKEQQQLLDTILKLDDEEYKKTVDYIDYILHTRSKD